MSVALARSERRELCDLMSTLGPGAPTLCEGWDAFDLAVHLHLRETDPIGAAGIVIGPLEQVTQRRMKRMRQEHSFDEVVELVRRGPGRLNPLRIGRVDELVNTLEFFVHHEDLRRGGEHQVRPRVLTTAADDWLWYAAVGLATRRLRRVRSGVLLQRVRAGRPSAEQAAVSTGRAPVFLRGEPGELVLWLYGRGAAAEVEFVGGADEVAKLQQLSLSI